MSDCGFARFLICKEETKFVSFCFGKRTADYEMKDTDYVRKVALLRMKKISDIICLTESTL